MKITQKIQCPNCGATSNFKDKTPGIFLCIYCGSSFEHISITSDLTVEKHFYNQVLSIYNEYVLFDIKRVKYHERMFIGIMKLDVNLDQIKNKAYQKKLFPKLIELMEREITIHKSNNITWNTSIEYKKGNEKVMQSLFYLKNYYRVLGHHYCKIYDTEIELNKALNYFSYAESIKAPTDSKFYTGLIRSKIGILNRLHQSSSAFEYLDDLLKNPLDFSINGPKEILAYREQLKVDFEDLFLSDAYKEYKAADI